MPERETNPNDPEFNTVTDAQDDRLEKDDFTVNEDDEDNPETMRIGK